jgi:glycosyltransferase involved in cell wall biosynthesis
MKNTLLVAHSNPRTAIFFGGTELLLQQILDQAEKNRNPLYFMYPDHSATGETWVIELDREVVARFSIEKKDNPRKVKAFSELLSVFLLKWNIDCLHVFHQLSTPLVLIPLANLLGLRTIYTIHDFIHICDSFNLINSKKEFCNIFSSETHNCGECAIARGVEPDSLVKRRIAYKRILDNSDLITVGTHFSGKATSDFYGLDVDKFRVIPPTIDSSAKRNLEAQPKSVLFLGNFTLPKGGDLIYRLVSDVRLGEFDFTQAGRVDLEYQAALKVLSKNFKFRSLGKYDLGETPKVNSSIAFFGSIWPETFCIAATEAIQLGLKIVVPRTGAFIDRFTNKENCFFYQPNDLDSAISAILIAEATPIAFTDIVERKVTYSNQIFDLYSSLDFIDRKSYSDVDFQSLQFQFPLDWIFEEISNPGKQFNSSKFSRGLDYLKSNGLRSTLKRLKREFWV